MPGVGWLGKAGHRASQILKWLAISLAGLLLFLVIALAGANLYLNTNSGRRLLESILSSSLHQEIRIGGLHLDLLHGLSLADVSIRDTGEFRDAPLGSIRALDLRYRLASLLGGVVHIERLRITDPDIAIVSRAGKWNFSALLGPAPGTEPGPAPTPTPVPGSAGPAPTGGAPTTATAPGGGPLFVLPVAVEIESLQVKGLKARFSMDEKMGATIEKLGLDLKGKGAGSSADLSLDLGTGGEPSIEFHMAGEQPFRVSHGVALKANVETRDLEKFGVKLDLGLSSATVSLGKEIRPMDVRVKVDGSADLASGDASIGKLLLEIGDAVEIETAGKLASLFTSPRADVTIDRGTISLDRLIPVAKQFLPGIEGKGEIRIEAFRVAGPLDGGREGDPLGVAGRMRLTGLDARLPAFGVEAAGIDGEVTIQGVEVVHYLPQALMNDVKLTIASASAAGATVKGVSLRASGKAAGVDLSQNAADLELTLESASYDHPKLGRIEAPPLGLKVKVLGNLPKGDIVQSSLELTLGKALTMKAAGATKAFGKESLTGKADLAVSLADCLPLIPPAIASDLGKLAARGTISLTTEATGKLPSDASPSSLSATGKIGLKGVGARLARIPASASGLDGEITFSGSASIENGPGPTSAKGKIAWASLEGPKGLALSKGNLALAAEVDPAAGRVKGASVVLDVPGLAALKAKASIEKWGKERFEADISLDGVKVAEVLRRLPPDLRKSLSDLSVVASPKLRVIASGRVPEPSELKTGKLPLSASLSFEVPDASVSWPARGLAVKKAGLAVQAEAHDEHLAAKWKTTVEGMGVPGSGEKESIDATVEAALALDSLDRLAIERIEASLPGRGATARLAGEVAGFRAILLGEAPATPAWILGKVAAQLRADASVNLGKGLQAIPDLKLEGSAGMELAVDLSPGKRLSVEGALSFDGLGVEKPPSFVARGLRGRFPIRKSLAIATEPSKPGPAPSAAAGRAARPEPSGGGNFDFLYSTLAPLRTGASKLTLDEVAARGLGFRNLFFDTRFEDRSFVVERFGLDLLRGRLGGSLTTRFTPTSNRIEVSMEFAEVNLKALVPFRVEVPDQEATVDGDLSLSISAARAGGRGQVGIEDLDADIHITRIGRKALDQLLLAMDPKGTDPSLGTMRTLLWTVQPSIDQVYIPIRNGSLGLTLYYSLNFNLPRFLSGFVGYFVDTRKSLSIFSKDIYSVFGRQDVKKVLDALGSLGPVLDAIGGETLLVEDSKILIR